MSSVSKALELLKHFSVDRPEIGLSEIRRLAQRDKATTYRHLQDLQAAGFIEQNPATRDYRLGPALLLLARQRELTVPRKAGALGPLGHLTDLTGETCHVAVVSGTTLYALIAQESSKHGIRAVIDIKTFPLHATASGLCALAFGPADLLDVALTDMPAITPFTPTTEADLRCSIDQARDTGFARGYGTYEDDVFSISAPIFDQAQRLSGTISVASVASRLGPDLENIILRGLMTASRDITRNWGGEIPTDLQRKWAQQLPTPKPLEHSE